jgi:hypothetical protein
MAEKSSFPFLGEAINICSASLVFPFVYTKVSFFAINRFATSAACSNMPPLLFLKSRTIRFIPRPKSVFIAFLTSAPDCAEKRVNQT